MVTQNTLEERYLMIPIRDRVVSLALNNRPSTLGGLSVEFTLDDGSRHAFEAWDNYCEVLKDIIVNYLQPNLRMSGPSQGITPTAINLKHGHAPHPMLHQ